MSGDRLLVVDDEPAIRSGIASYFSTKGFIVDQADGCVGAEDTFRAFPADAIISESSLADGDGLALLGRLRTLDPRVRTVVLTSKGTIDLAVQAIKEGAEQFLTKPVEMAQLHIVVERALERRRRPQASIVRPPLDRHEADIFRGTSPAIRALEAEARRVLPSQSPIFIRGETGSGKGLLAQWLHQNGRRASEAFVDLNCAGLAPELLESELFGHDRGAFTGAVAAKQGLLEIADRGTIFLDEVGDMAAAVQPKLLKVLEENRYRRLGNVHDRRVDVRIITATHHDLEALVARGGFRQDLYYRIGILPLRVPPLRERREDIALLAQDFANTVAANLGCPHVIISPEGLSLLEAYSWPGNVRELRNAMERAVLMADSGTIGRRQLAFLARPGPAIFSSGVFARCEQPPASPPRLGGARPFVEVEREHIRLALEEAGGKVELVAARLGIPRSSLYHKIRKYGLSRS